MTTDRQEAEKKAQALLKFALGNHNAKRYGEAAGFYEAILQRHPDTEAAQYARTNLESLVNKVEGLEPIQPDETLIARIEQPAAPAPEQVAQPAAASPSAPAPKLEPPSPAPDPQPSDQPAWKRLRITENPYLLAGLFFLTATVSYFAGREHVKYEIRQVFTGAAEGFRKNMAGAMDPLKNLGQGSASSPTPSKQEIDQPKALTFPVKLELVEFKRIGGMGWIDVSLKIENPINRPLKAFEGELLIKDVFGKQIDKRSLSYRNRVAAKSNFTWSGLLQYYEPIEKDQLTLDLVVHKIAYEDGTIEEFTKPK